ncbi:hypothetical protein GCM10023149_15310 [Mucilaginibacter gynuensis]|uniref:Uncharacterized protein n=1 Tax=Mucilaginibacter gynuensis TaxID=1302236 RepID=A0ABP8G5F0_9SPHI
MTFKLGDFFPGKPINEPSLDLDNPIWKKLEGGYRNTKYDASVALKILEKANNLAEYDKVYKELWDELHHQGDIGLASYYAVPHLVRIASEKQLVDYNVLALVALIEVRRYRDNPKVPNALLPYYNEALATLGELAKFSMNKDWDLTLASSALAAIAVSKGQHKLAEAIFALDSEDVLDEFLDTY